jgi:DNA-binding beta-propeller fold protein YncE
MKRYLAVVLSVLVGMSWVAAAQKARDGVVVDPDVHNVVLENEHVRVLEARAAHGRRSPMHSHPSLVLVSIGSARIKLTFPDGKSSILDVRPGQVLWLDNPEHSWELLAGELHVVAVEIKSAQKAQPK